MQQPEAAPEEEIHASPTVVLLHLPPPTAVLPIPTIILPSCFRKDIPSRQLRIPAPCLRYYVVFDLMKAAAIPPRITAYTAMQFLSTDF